MANKSGTSEQVISLPTSGGALSGIGETFAPDLHTGTGNFTVPIALPPGRNGFQPQISLVYSTGNGNSHFGLGWSLSIPGISRKTSKGVPQYRDDVAVPGEHDTFILSGAEDLVPVSGGLAGVTRYQPRTEGLFARIERHHDAHNDFWRVRSKDGLVSCYGTPAARGGDPAVIAASVNRDNVFSWQITETTDPFGNLILYDYERDTAEEGPHHWDQLYLKRIRYVDTPDERGVEPFLVSVTFAYAERPDPFSDYRAGFEVRTRRRCTEIIVCTHAGPARTVRRTRLIYLDQHFDMPHLADLIPHNRVSMLSQVRVEGVDEARPADKQVEVLPPLEFSYTAFDPAARRYQPLTAVNSLVPESSLAHPEYELVDLFGNGLPDVVHMNGTVRYWHNLGGGCFDFPQTMVDAPAAVDLADAGVQMADLDGDGRTDLLVTDGIRGGYYSLTSDGRWDRQSFTSYKRVPAINLEAPDVRLVDLDGDGITDALRTGASFELYFNDQYEGWIDLELRTRDELEQFPSVNFDDPRVKLADMTGDDLQDIVLINNGYIDYWPYMGYGRWGRRITMSNSPEFEDAAFSPSVGFDPKRVLLGDVDGDGLADLVYVSSGHITVWINQSGNGWSAPIEIHGTPAISNMDAVRLADMLGTGTAGILWTYDFNAQLDSTYKFLDLTGGVKPYLLCRMDNHMGARTHVTYTSSTEFYRVDAENATTRWITTLPFPVQVVKQVVVKDYFSMGRLTTEYRYHHGYWDGAEREFRGFGMVEQLDTEIFPANLTSGPIQFTPPLLTKTWFHQGPIGPGFSDWEEADYSHEYWPDDPAILRRPSGLVTLLQNPDIARRIKRDAVRSLRGRMLRTELYALDGSVRQDRPYTVTEYQYGVRPEMLPRSGEAGRLPIFFPHLVAQRTTQWERGNDPMTQFSFTQDYDEFGQPQGQTTVACPRGWRKLTDRPREPYLATRSRTVYARPPDSGNYIMDRVASTTTYEIVNDGSWRVMELRNLPEDDPALNVIGQTVNFYDGPAFTGAAFGEIQHFGALVRSESLVLIAEILNGTYPADDPVLANEEPPPYFAHTGSTGWPQSYPDEFTARHFTDQHTDSTRPGLSITPLNYGFAAGDAGSPFRTGYFVAATRQRYDFHDDPTGQGRGLLVASRDPLGRDTPERDTAISYDTFALLPAAVTDPVGLTTRAEYDYRVMQPWLVTDPNANRSQFHFTPLGLLREIFVRGKADADEGDKERASTHFDYDFLAFANSPPDKRRPIFVRTIQHEHHDMELDVERPERDATIETFEYSDGIGRLLQTRTQAEDVLFGDTTLDAPLFGNDVLPADQGDKAGTLAPVVGRQRGQDDLPNVVVSGWQIYDNKGQVVEKFEPFFSRGFEYLSPEEEQTRFGRNVLGQKVAMFYEPRGQVIRTVSPNGSEQRVIYGVPKALDTPDDFVPTPWEAYTYDANDLAPLSEGPLPDGTTGLLADRAPQHHHFTPAHIVIDAMGRTRLTVERNRADAASPVEQIATRSTSDIRGNLLAVTDALDREAFHYTYDLANNPLRIQNIDAGVRRIVLDAAGNEVERRDSKGVLILQAHDLLNRPIRLWARDGGDSPVTLREHLIYGDSAEAGVPDAATLNLLGKLYRHYDEAGLLTFDAYDFKGNLLEQVRQTIRDEEILTVFAVPRPGGVPVYRVDWQPPATGTLADREPVLLDSTEYQTSTTYDALNRVKAMRYPQDVDGGRKELRPQYNHAGALERVELGGKIYVERIAYNAKGQRSLIALGNGMMTRYTFVPRTFRLHRLRSEGYTRPDDLSYQPGGGVWQDFAYDYDLVGNILSIHDRAPGSGTRGRPDALDRAFSYDAVYRLTSASGREHVTPGPALPWEDQPKSQDVTQAQAYTEAYQYDRVGNILTLSHSSGNGSSGSFTRRFELAEGNNQLRQLTVGNGGSTPPFAYTYDANGNMIAETTSRHFEWDHSDQMKAFRTQAGTSEPSVHAHYLYDANGMRVKKLVRKQGGRFESTTYIDGVSEHHRWQGNGEVGENSHLHVMDDQQRVALVRVGTPHLDDRGPAVQYHLGDHLGSSNLVLDQAGSFVNREEYTPYGETSFGHFARKRNRFTGKERDEESGLYYHGARYYAPWLGRWISIDAAGNVDGLNLYAYVGNNPLLFVDPDGKQRRKTGEEIQRVGGSIVETKRAGPHIEIHKCLEFDPYPPVKAPVLDKPAGVAIAQKYVVERPDLQPNYKASDDPFQRSADERFYERQEKDLIANLRAEDRKLERQQEVLERALNTQAYTSQELFKELTLVERSRLSTIYLQINRHSRELYVGSTTGDEFGRFSLRQYEHWLRTNQDFEWRILERVEPSLRKLTEESWIRRFGGPSRYGGRLKNWRYEVNNEAYEAQMRSRGLRPVKRPTPNRAPNRIQRMRTNMPVRLPPRGK